MENKRKITELILSVSTLVFAFLAWQSVRDAIIVPNSSTWVVPMIFFSVYIIFVYLGAVLLRNDLFLRIVLFGSLLLSLIFAFELLQFLAILLGGFFLFLAVRRIKEDMDFNLKISIWKSLRAGKTYMLIAITVIITMQYYVVMSNFDGEKKVPHFDASFVTKKIAIPFLSSVSPQFKSLEDETLTVDQFILQTQKDAAGDNNFLTQQNEQLLDAQIPANLSPAQRAAIKQQAMENFSNAESQLSKKNQELILVAGRAQFSDLTGTVLTGSEKISDIFTGLVNNKIDQYFNPGMSGEEKNPTFSMILAAVLFLTIYPIGSVMSILWFLIVKFVVLVLLKTKVLGVKTVAVSKEILE